MFGKRAISRVLDRRGDLGFKVCGKFRVDNLEGVGASGIFRGLRYGNWEAVSLFMGCPLGMCLLKY